MCFTRALLSDLSDVYRLIGQGTLEELVYERQSMCHTLASPGYAKSSTKTTTIQAIERGDI